MNGISVYQTSSGWIYEVRYMGCPIVIEYCATLGAATGQAFAQSATPLRHEAGAGRGARRAGIQAKTVLDSRLRGKDAGA